MTHDVYGAELTLTKNSWNEIMCMEILVPESLKVGHIIVIPVEITKDKTNHPV